MTIHCWTLKLTRDDLNGRDANSFCDPPAFDGSWSENYSLENSFTSADHITLLISFISMSGGVPSLNAIDPHHLLSMPELHIHLKYLDLEGGGEARNRTKPDKDHVPTTVLKTVIDPYSMRL